MDVIEIPEFAPYITNQPLSENQQPSKDEIMIALDLRFCRTSASIRILQNSLSLFRGTLNKMLNNIYSVNLPECIENNGIDKRYPRVGLNLIHVFGFEAFHRRNNLKYVLAIAPPKSPDIIKDKGRNPEESMDSVNKNQLEDPFDIKIAYFVSRVVILLDTKNNSQSIYEKHSTKVTNIAVHPSKQIIASASSGFYAVIEVWDVKSSNPHTNFNTGHTSSIFCMKFSADGSYIGSVATDERYSIQITDWECNEIIAFRNTSPTPILDFEFNPTNRLEFATGQYNSVSVYTIENRSILLLRIVSVNLIEKEGLPFITCLVWMPYTNNKVVTSDILVGNNFGDLGVVVQEKYIPVKKTAHKKMITSLLLTDTLEHIIVTSGEDEFIKLWSMDFELLTEFNVRLSPLIQIANNSDVIYRIIVDQPCRAVSRLS